MIEQWFGNIGWVLLFKFLAQARQNLYASVNKTTVSFDNGLSHILSIHLTFLSKIFMDIHKWSSDLYSWKPHAWKNNLLHWSMGQTLYMCAVYPQQMAHCVAYNYMMASSNGNIFRFTGPLCGEFTGQRWIPLTKASDTQFCVLFDLGLYNRLSEQS